MKDITDEQLHFMLAANGFIFPSTDAEMDAFDEVHKDYELKNMPEGINAQAILDKYYKDKEDEKNCSKN